MEQSGVGQVHPAAWHGRAGNGAQVSEQPRTEAGPQDAQGEAHVGEEGREVEAIAPERGLGHAAAVRLPDRQEVEAGGDEAAPPSDRGGVQADGGAREGGVAKERAAHAAQEQRALEEGRGHGHERGGRLRARARVCGRGREAEEEERQGHEAAGQRSREGHVPQVVVIAGDRLDRRDGAEGAQLAVGEEVGGPEAHAAHGRGDAVAQLVRHVRPERESSNGHGGEDEVDDVLLGHARDGRVGVKVVRVGQGLESLGRQPRHVGHHPELEVRGGRQEEQLRAWPGKGAVRAADARRGRLRTASDGSRAPHHRCKEDLPPRGRGRLGHLPLQDDEGGAVLRVGVRSSGVRWHRVRDHESHEAVLEHVLHGSVEPRKRLLLALPQVAADDPGPRAVQLQELGCFCERDGGKSHRSNQGAIVCDTMHLQCVCYTSPRRVRFADDGAAMPKAPARILTRLLDGQHVCDPEREGPKGGVLELLHVLSRDAPDAPQDADEPLEVPAELVLRLARLEPQGGQQRWRIGGGACSAAGQGETTGAGRQAGRREVRRTPAGRPPRCRPAAARAG